MNESISNYNPNVSICKIGFFKISVLKNAYGLILFNIVYVSSYIYQKNDAENNPAEFKQANCKERIIIQHRFFICRVNFFVAPHRKEINSKYGSNYINYLESLEKYLKLGKAVTHSS